MHCCAFGSWLYKILQFVLHVELRLLATRTIGKTRYDMNVLYLSDSFIERRRRPLWIYFNFQPNHPIISWPFWWLPWSSLFVFETQSHLRGGKHRFHIDQAVSLPYVTHDIDPPQLPRFQEFGGTDLGNDGIENFMAHHRCGRFDRKPGTGVLGKRGEVQEMKVSESYCCIFLKHQSLFQNREWIFGLPGFSSWFEFDCGCL